MFKTEKKILYFQVFFATFIWGASYPFTKYLVNYFEPQFIVFVRALLGSFLFVTFTKINIRKYLNLKIIVRLFVLSVFGISLQQYVQAYGLKYTTSTNGGFIIAVTPIIIVLMEVFLGARITFLKLLSFVFGIAGTLLVSYSMGSFDFSIPSTKGDIMFLSSSFLWGFYVILTKRWFDGWDQIEITALTMIIALITLFPFIFYDVNSVISQIVYFDSFSVFSFIYLGVLSSYLGYMYWNKAVDGLGTIKTSYFIYDEPFATVISAYIVLKEKVMFTSVFGGILILTGVYFIIKEKEKEIGYEI